MLVLITVSTTSASNVTVHPHIGNTYWVGANGHKISLINNNSAVNPTYSQLISFIKKDKTDERIYISQESTHTEILQKLYIIMQKRLVSNQRV